MNENSRPPDMCPLLRFPPTIPILGRKFRDDHRDGIWNHSAVTETPEGMELSNSQTGLASVPIVIISDR